MTGLAEKRCIPCMGGVPPIEAGKAEQLLGKLGGGWGIVDGHHLKKIFSFNSFMESVDFVGKVAALAEEQGHHPNIYIDFRDVVLTIWTHKIDGLAESDFILAAKIDEL